MEYNSFVSCFPGFESTQLVTLIGYKRGVWFWPYWPLLIWITLAHINGRPFILLTYFTDHKLTEGLFKYIQPMAIGFLLFAAVRAFNNISVKNTHHTGNHVDCHGGHITHYLKYPGYFYWSYAWGIATNFSKRIPEKNRSGHKTDSLD